MAAETFRETKHKEFDASHPWSAQGREQSSLQTDRSAYDQSFLQDTPTPQRRSRFAGLVPENSEGIEFRPVFEEQTVLEKLQRRIQAGTLEIQDGTEQHAITTQLKEIFNQRRR